MFGNARSQSVTSGETAAYLGEIYFTGIALQSDGIRELRERDKMCYYTTQYYKGGDDALPR